MQKEAIHQEIHSQITQNNVVLFMKGTPELPQCGFSSTSVQILQHLKVPFKAVNVLADDNIRSGIKEYSDWPTIPQLYVKGEFIGGSDIIREMFETNELAELFSQHEIIQKKT